MTKKRCVLLSLLMLFLSISIHASVEEPKENSFVKKTKKVYAQIVKGKEKVVDLVKKHPFIAMFAVATVVSKKMRKRLYCLPNGILQETKDHPIVMALIGGFLLSYIVN